MEDQTYDLGIVGLGVMGRNLLLNVADRGFSAVGYDRDSEKIEALRKEGAGKSVEAAESIQQFVAALRRPRAAMMLVPAGSAVDSVIGDLLPHLDRGDVVIDAGNSLFHDTDLRGRTLEEKDLAYLGVGVSGGEYGARHGPSIMPGGPRDAYERVRPIFEAAAAKVDGEPCVTYLGPRSAGHYVKMVHNGIEYGLMQLIAESYDLMKRGLGLSDDELAEVYQKWNEGGLSGFLIEITGNIFSQVDERTGRRLIDVILDEAKQKGTGMWTSQDAMELQVPTPTVDVAVAVRHLSALKEEREKAHGVFGGPSARTGAHREAFIGRLERAMFAASIIAFAQGMAQLRRASQQYEYGYELAEVARIWRGGCIIRTRLLEDIREALKKDPDLPNLLLDERLGKAVEARVGDLRSVVQAAVGAGLPTPALGVSLAYFDAYRSQWLPANLVQAQRDYFGSHTYERIDSKGTFHTQWRHPADREQEKTAGAAAGGRP